TTSLSIGARGKNGVGISVTKLLTLKASIPAVVSTVSGQIAGVCGSNSYDYTMTASPLANSYIITGPEGSVITSDSNTTNESNILTTSDLIFNVLYPADLATLATKNITVSSVNGVGTSLTDRTLKISTAMPAIGAVTGSHGIKTFQRCLNQTFTVPEVSGATSYEWIVADGAVIVSGEGTNSVEVDFTAVSDSALKTLLKVTAKNTCDVSSAVKTITLNTTTCGSARTIGSSDKALVVYPNPVIDIVTITNGNLITSVSVFNLVGQQVLSARPNAMATTMDMGNLPVGTYLLKIQSEGKISTVKVVKNH
ncbi:MAG: T9SS type A sorting domain-containing protein, partial [Flavobacterium sp.]